MKSASATLQDVLYNHAAHLIADLVTIYFPDGSQPVTFSTGTQRYWTGAAALTIGTDTYQPGHIGVSDLKQGLGSESETFEIDFGVTTQTVAGLSFTAAALVGLFNGVRVKVQRARTLTTFTGYAAADLESVFDGVVTRAIPRTDTVVSLSLQGAISLGKVPVSKRRVSADCPFSFGDATCGVTVASFRHTKSVASGSTASVVKLNSTSTFAVTGSVLAITSGLWSGQTRVVRSVSGVDLTLDVALPGVEVGASCTVTRACDKKIATCSGVFSNALRCGCAPNAPADRK